jgi:hypothetical protein
MIRKSAPGCYFAVSEPGFPQEPARLLALNGADKTMGAFTGLPFEKKFKMFAGETGALGKFIQFGQVVYIGANEIDTLFNACVRSRDVAQNETKQLAQQDVYHVFRIQRVPKVRIIFILRQNFRVSCYFAFHVGHQPDKSGQQGSGRTKHKAGAAFKVFIKFCGDGFIYAFPRGFYQVVFTRLGNNIHPVSNGAIPQ